jgi:hypothetical protein
LKAPIWGRPGKWPVKVHKESGGLHKAFLPCENPKADVFLNPAGRPS